MGNASFVAGDWGTTHLRLFLCEEDGAALDSCVGPGVAHVSGRFADTFESLTAPWERLYGALPAVLCGMVGSNIGWTEAPYVACPAIPEQIADSCVTLRGGAIHVVPGLSCRNCFSAPDFMRGEETQILGALNLVESMRQGNRLMCLPGTHTKWVVLKNGSVREFLTAPTGELFALLCKHSVLVGKHSRVEGAVDAATFEEGLARFDEFPQAQLLHRLFECRSRQLKGELVNSKADAYLSGLLVASDLHGALRMLSSAIETDAVCVIGSSVLAQLYVRALKSQGYNASLVEGAAASRTGLAQVRRLLSLRVAAHDV